MVPRKYLLRKSVLKRITHVLTCILLIFTLSAATIYKAGSTGSENRITPSDHCDGGSCCIMSDCSCPNCDGRGEPGGICDDCGGDLCSHCGNCYSCGESPCPECRLYCYDCGSLNLCATCNGCLDCGYNRKDGCPECGSVLAPAALRNHEVIVENVPVPLFSADGRDFFLFAPMSVPTWSVFNLILTAAGVILSIFTILRAFLQKKEEFNNLDAEAEKIMEKESALTGDFLAAVDNENLYSERRRLTALIIKYLLSFCAALLLLLTQNFKGAVAIFDIWSVLHAAFFTGIIISGHLVFKTHKKEVQSECFS
ncbi:MAG: hypothetical protein FWD38_01460 [Oscillospiraceae bacterium]|nr:hypothetical protein [Oscillospiraceae bacterium]